MNFYLRFNSSKREEADGIFVNFNRLGDISKDEKKRIIIEIDGNPNYTKTFRLEQLGLFREKITNNFICATNNLGILRELIQEKIPVYLDYQANNWETAISLCDLGVSALVIDGELGFSFDAIKKLKEKYNIEIYAYPNKPTIFSTLESFFVRPEDIPLYEGMVDALLFTSDNEEKQEVLFDIYKKGYSTLEVNTLYNHFVNKEYDFSNSLLPKIFSEKRFNCKQICKNPSKQCNFCKTVFETTQKMNRTFN